LLVATTFAAKREKPSEPIVRKPAEPRSDVIDNVRSVVLKESESLEDPCPKIKGYDFNNGVNYSELLKSMASTGFQASNLGDAIDTVNQMIGDFLMNKLHSEEENNPAYRESVKCKIFLGFTSNLISSGVRDSIRYLVQHRMVTGIFVDF
ncbi:deoxyhypusine synthase, partial [Tanacetum coccineum]